jgi:nitrogen fixation NifU-like protein
MSAIPDPQFDELFREIILDHYRKPRNRGHLADATAHAEGMNPVCGDAIELDLRLDGEAINDIAFAGEGCSISQASASLMTERLKGRPVDEARQVTGKFRAMMMDGAEPDPDLGDLEALQGVAKFPARVKCALLVWNVLQEALQQPKPATPGGPQ